MAGSNRHLFPFSSNELSDDSGQLARTGLSNNVGGVKHFSSVLIPALREERHFALVEKVPCPTKARSQSVFRSELGPTHASLRSQP